MTDLNSGTDNNRSAVLVTVDSLRRDAAPPPDGGDAFGDAVSAMGADCEVTPLQNLWAAGPYTSLAFKSMLSGERPLRYDGAIVDKRLNSKRRYLPELLPDDVTTVGVTANITTSRHGGWERGWDRLVDFTSDVDSDSFGNRKLRNLIKRALSSIKSGARLAQFLYRLKNIWNKSLPFPDGETVIAAVEQELEDVDPPVFLWVHFMEPHTPWLPVEQRETASMWTVAELHSRLETNQERLDDDDRHRLAELYRARAATSGQKVAELFRVLQSYPWFDGSLRLLMADHGEELGENGWFGHTHLNAPTNLSRELIHVPGYIVAPGESINRNTVCGHADVTPTICEWFDTEPDAPDGESLLKDARKSWSFSEYELPENDEFGVACQSNAWQYLRVEQGGKPITESFMRTADARDGNPPEETATKLVEATVERIAARQRDGVQTEGLTVGSDVESRLESLGYR